MLGMCFAASNWLGFDTQSLSRKAGLLNPSRWFSAIGKSTTQREHFRSTDYLLMRPHDVASLPAEVTANVFVSSKKLCSTSAAVKALSYTLTSSMITSFHLSLLTVV
jgi:hypothetical protein